MLVGTTLQGYPLEKFLGAGGFGAVYLTADANGEPRAVKVLFPPHSLGNEDMEVWAVRSAHFLTEATTTTASFQHPNIIRVFNTSQAYWHYQDPLRISRGIWTLAAPILSFFTWPSIFPMG
jgi:serine/threonine protein kinase